MSPCIAAMYGIPPCMNGFHLRESMAALQRLRGEIAEGVAGEILIAARVDEKMSCERRVSEQHRCERVHDRGERTRMRRPGEIDLFELQIFELWPFVEELSRSRHPSARKVSPGSSSVTVSQRRDVIAISTLSAAWRAQDAKCQSQRAFANQQAPRREEGKITEEVGPRPRGDVVRERSRGVSRHPAHEQLERGAVEQPRDDVAGDGENTARWGTVPRARDFPVMRRATSRRIGRAVGSSRRRPSPRRRARGRPSCSRATAHRTSANRR